MNKQYIYGTRYENRVTMSSDVDRSDASITIDQLTMDDNGTYECSVSLLSDLDGTSRSRTRLLVLGECPHLFLQEKRVDKSPGSSIQPQIQVQQGLIISPVLYWPCLSQSRVRIPLLPLEPDIDRVLSEQQAGSEGRGFGVIPCPFCPFSPSHQLFPCQTHF